MFRKRGRNLVQVITTTTLNGRKPNHKGKVRDTYVLPDGRRLIVATDRISALDVVLPNGVPYKGEVLTRISAWWFQNIMHRIPHHFIALPTPETAGDLLGFELPPEFYGRTMLVRSLKPYKAECIVRGNITGSGWKDYRNTGMVCGISLPEELLESQELPEPLFTPSTKAETGHDENISFEKLVAIVGHKAAVKLELLSLEIFKRGREAARQMGIIIADTKFEFGEDPDGEVVLIDELLTPDSSRFWPLEGFEPGHGQPSFDKQPVRDWLEGEKRGGRWDGKSKTAPSMTPQLVEATSIRYRKMLKLFTGEELAE